MKIKKTAYEKSGLMNWKFKTLAGVQKRAAFETAHSKRFRYYPVPIVNVAGEHYYAIQRVRK